MGRPRTVRFWYDFYNSPSRKNKNRIGLRFPYLDRLFWKGDERCPEIYELPPIEQKMSDFSLGINSVPTQNSPNAKRPLNNAQRLLICPSRVRTRVHVAFSGIKKPRKAVP